MRAPQKAMTGDDATVEDQLEVIDWRERFQMTSLARVGWVTRRVRQSVFQ